MKSNPEEKCKRLCSILGKMESVLIAFSGGTDSAFLLKTASDILGEHVIAVTARSQLYPEREYNGACSLAEDIGVRHITIRTEQLDDPQFRKNVPERCYFCKTGLFSVLKGIADKENISMILDGAHADDTDDFRPGMKAAREMGVRSPLKEAGLTKRDIRELSKELGLPTWDWPSSACLASRFPYGDPITEGGLNMVEQGERFIMHLGYRQVRVRHHGKLARIEVRADDIEKICSPGLRSKIFREFRQIGYTYVTIDMQGYRTGSMNEVLPLEYIKKGETHGTE